MSCGMWMSVCRDLYQCRWWCCLFCSFRSPRSRPFRPPFLFSARGSGWWVTPGRKIGGKALRWRMHFVRIAHSSPRFWSAAPFFTIVFFLCGFFFAEGENNNVWSIWPRANLYLGLSLFGVFFRRNKKIWRLSIEAFPP